MPACGKVALVLLLPDMKAAAAAEKFSFSQIEYMPSGLGFSNVLWEQQVLLQHLCQKINLLLLPFVGRHQSIHLCLERCSVAV